MIKKITILSLLLLTFYTLTVLGKNTCCLQKYQSSLTIAHSAMKELLSTQNTINQAINEYEKAYSLLIHAFCCCDQSNKQLEYEKKLWLDFLSSLEEKVLSISFQSTENRALLQTIKHLSQTINSMQNKEYQDFIETIREIAPSCFNNSH